MQALRELRPGIIRFGGSALDDSNLGEFDWRDTLGDPKRAEARDRLAREIRDLLVADAPKTDKANLELRAALRVDDLGRLGHITLEEVEFLGPVGRAVQADVVEAFDVEISVRVAQDLLHALFARPMVVGPKSPVALEIVPGTGDAVVTCDGRRTVRVPHGARRWPEDLQPQ